MTSMCMEIKTPTYSTCNIRIRQLVISISTSLDLVNSQLFWTYQHGYPKGKGESNSYFCYRMVLYKGANTRRGAITALPDAQTRQAPSSHSLASETEYQTTVKAAKSSALLVFKCKARTRTFSPVYPNSVLTTRNC